jgi:uncharacterized membrane protein YccC
MIAALAAIVPRLLSGPAEHPVFPMSTPSSELIRQAPRPQMGLQAAIATLVIVALKQCFGLEKSAWAITACTYVIAGSASGTMDRVLRRIIGTVIGVPLGLACLPIAVQLPIVIWIFAAAAMVVYAMALPERYDIASGGKSLNASLLRESSSSLPEVYTTFVSSHSAVNLIPFLKGAQRRF